MTDDLESFELLVPPVPTASWEEGVKDADGAHRALILQQLRFLNLLKGLPERTRATPGRLAWLTMWVKAVRAMDAALGCIERRNDIAIRILGRTVVELGLQLSAIFRPVTKWSDFEDKGMKVTKPKGMPDDWRQVLDRLCAYAAWCLHGDLEQVKFLLHPANRRDVWDPGPVQQLLADPDRRRMHEALYGPLQVTSERELGRQQQEWAEGLQKRKKRIEAWQTHPDVRDWVERLRSLNGPAGFFALLDEGEPSLRQYLKARGLMVAYWQYKRYSSLIHGAGVGDFLPVKAKLIIAMPRALDDEAAGDAAEEWTASCTQAWAMLGLLKPRLWPETDFAGGQATP